ncbi:hypothetical protein niasHT_011252 [Heterodera trifolii]|uniref:E2F/DP family winged-helix DNA-binding domain-containing protein n=1 Tax=Heterodera trifolii TaxID=157864 RepID=A0ABD2L6A0_9BILA
MDSENVYVDVCGEGEDEENKENCENGNLRNAGTVPMLKIKLSQVQKQRKIARENEENSEEEDSEEEGEGARTSLGGTSGDGEERHETSGTAKRRGGAPRKEKSLGRLCNRFLERMGEESRDGRDIHLESVARKMSVEKRRIYDIVNVMEALEAMSKTNKSFYRWHGLGQLPKLIHSLQSEAMHSNLPQRVDEVAKKMCTFVELSNASPTLYEKARTNDGFGRDSPSATDAAELNCSELTNSEQDEASTPRDRCGKNSLAQLCRRFLMVLLSKQSRKVSLDVTSTVLIKNPDRDGFEPPPRSKCRRLYDIANVLVAMRLILKKHALFGTKKIPLFEYCGPEPDADPAAGHLRMMEFLQRSGLTKAAAESVKGAEEEKKKPNSDQKKEQNRKRKGEFSAQLTQAKTIKRETDESTECQRTEIKKAKVEEPTTAKMNPTAQLPRPKPMLPFGPFEPSPNGAPPNAFFCRPQQSNLSFWPPPMALISSLIGRSPPNHLPPSLPSSLPSPLPPSSQHFVPTSSASFPSFPVPPSKSANVAPLPKVRHSVQSILGVSQKENIGNMSSTVPNSNVLKENTKIGPTNVFRPFHSNTLSSSPKAFKPVLQQRQNFNNF